MNCLPAATFGDTFPLAVASCEMHGRTLVRDVEMSVLRGLQQACLNGELQDADQKLVEAMRQRLLTQVKR